MRFDVYTKHDGVIVPLGEAIAANIHDAALATACKHFPRTPMEGMSWVNASVFSGDRELVEICSNKGGSGSKQKVHLVVSGRRYR
jgi:hypothetical protein